MSILIVDDNTIQRMVLKCNLSKNGYEVLMATTGPEALQQLKAHPDIRVVITDIMMPDMDGLELIRQMKQEVQWDSIPVIICTALADTDHVQQAVKLGCRHYLVKPVDGAKLLQKVKEALESFKPVLQTPLQIMEKLGLDTASYASIAGAFETHIAEQIALIEKILADPKAPRSALNLAGLNENAQLLGAHRLANLIQRFLPPAATSPMNREDYRRLLAELQQVARGLAANTLLAAPLEREKQRLQTQDQP